MLLRRRVGVHEAGDGHAALAALREVCSDLEVWARSGQDMETALAAVAGGGESGATPESGPRLGDGSPASDHGSVLLSSPLPPAMMPRILVLVDNRMPGMSGPEFVRLARADPAVRAHQAGVVFVGVTGESDAAKVFAGTGVVACAEKPLTDATLAVLLELQPPQGRPGTFSGGAALPDRMPRLP